jgi:hypothetical protein
VAAMLRVNKCWWRGMLLLTSLSLWIPMRSLAMQTTNVSGTVYRADGSLAQGTMLVSWPGFTAADGSAVAAGNTTVTIAPDGSVSMTLAPNAGANPQGTYYTVVYHMNDGTVQKEYWVVPQVATAAISAVRARVVPAAVAQQSVTQQYVDTSIGALQSSYLQLKGGTMAGALDLSNDPTDAMQAATKEYVDAHAGAQLPQAQNVIAGKGDGGAVSIAEKGVSVTGTNGMVAWDEDLKAGIYDPRDPRWAGGIYGPTPVAAAQAMSNQMACDLAMGVVAHAYARWPQGNFPVDQLLIAPGSSWEGVANAQGGTHWHAVYNNHQMALAPISMTVTCSDGLSHTDSAFQTHFAHFTLQGCGTGGCSNAPGDTGSYGDGGPGNTGLEMSSGGGIVEYTYAEDFGGYGIRVDNADAKAFHDTVNANLDWYYYGGYKGFNESLASPEISATTTGTTGSVALSWAAVSGATNYNVYRGSTSGAEGVWFQVATNSFTDIGAAGTAGSVTGAPTFATAPGSPTATPSTTGGTLAAGNHYYVISAVTPDAWHGSIEVVGADNMADWIEAYGFFDVPTPATYHHLADFLGGGGDTHFDHIWAQLGQVGIAQPYGAGIGDSYENIRADFTRLEGFWSNDGNVSVHGGILDGSCTAANAQTINIGQDNPFLAGTCDQLNMFGTGGALVTDVYFAQNNGFGPSFETADYEVNGIARVTSGVPQFANGLGLLSGSIFQPNSDDIKSVTGAAPVITGLHVIYPADTTPTTILGFLYGNQDQDLYILGGNANVTLNYDTSNLTTCSRQNVNLGNVHGFMHFHATSNAIYSGLGTPFSEVCADVATSASSETVTYSATPTFSIGTRASILTLAGNVTSFTLAAGADGQEKTLEFCQNATGGYTAAAPANVRGFFTVGMTASKCSSQHFTYSAGQATWLADSPGVVNE